MAKILVIEDETAIRENITELLMLEGFDWLSAENGLIGVELARENLPDLIVCDIKMPGLDGHHVLAELRGDPKTATIPFLFLTAHSAHSDMRLGMEMGADDYLTKPFLGSELLAAVNAQLSKRAVLTEVSESKMEDLRQNIIFSLPHELRTPLSNILGYAEMLANGAQDMNPQEVADMSSTISKAARRLQRLIENYMAYAQIEVTRTKPEWVKGLRSPLTREAQNVIGQQATVCARRVKRDADLVLSKEPLPPVQIAEFYLTKIVQELADNAFKFSNPGKTIYVAATATDDHFILRITDGGHGMTREQIAGIGAYMQFERQHYEQQGSAWDWRSVSGWSNCTAAN